MAESFTRDDLLAFDADFTTLVSILADDSRDGEIRRTLHTFRDHPNRLGVALNSLLGLTDDEVVDIIPAEVLREGEGVAAMARGRLVNNVQLPGSSKATPVEMEDDDEFPAFLPQYQKQKQETVVRRQELLDPKQFLPNDFLAKFPDPVAFFNDTTRPVGVLYKQHALIQLQNDFPRVTENSLRQYMSISNHHYYPTKKQIQQAINGGGQPQVQQQALAQYANLVGGPFAGIPVYPNLMGGAAGAYAMGNAVVMATGTGRGGKRMTKKQKAEAAAYGYSASITFLDRPRAVPLQWPQELCEEFFYELQLASHEKRILKRMGDLQRMRQLKVEMAREDGLSWDCAVCGDECLPEEAPEAAKGVCPTCAQTFGNTDGVVSAKELASIIQTALGGKFELLAAAEESSVSYFVQGLCQQWERLDNTATIMLERFFHAAGKTANVGDLDFDFVKGTVSLHNRSYVLKRQTDNIPVFWLANRAQASHSKIDLSPNSLEFKRIVKVINAGLNGTPQQQQMFGMLPGTNLNSVPVAKIQRIENIALYSQYLIQKEKVRRACPAGHAFERQLFHGTMSANMNGICENGFDRSRAGTAVGTVLGHGTYFSPHFQVSRGYAKDGQLLYCNVLVGESVQGNGNMRILPNKPNSPFNYESAVDNVAGPSAYVIFADCNAYPAYLITLSGFGYN